METFDTFTTPDGLRIFYRTVRAEDERAGLVIAHGLGEHSGRYGNVIQPLLASGISVWAPDHRGHGCSPGPRGHVDAFDRYVEDLGQMIRKTRAQLPKHLKLFLLGHSMGGLISLLYALKFPEKIDGVIVSSPALGIRVSASALRFVVKRVLVIARLRHGFGSWSHDERLSHDPEVIRMMHADPLVHQRITPCWLWAFFRAVKAAHRRAPRMALPTLMQVAGADTVVDSRASARFYRRLAVRDKAFLRYDGLYHEIYNELPVLRAAVLEDLQIWLDRRIGRPHAAEVGNFRKAFWFCFGLRFS